MYHVLKSISEVHRTSNNRMTNIDVKPRNLISTSVGQTIQNLDFGQKHATFQAVWVPSEANSEVAVYLFLCVK